MSQPGHLVRVREQRAALRVTMGVVEAAAAAPLAGRGEEWRKTLLAALDELDAAWARHVTVTESADGLFAQVRHDAPQLEPRLTKLHKEHDDIGQQVTTLREALDGAGAEPDALAPHRGGVVDLIADLVRHRQHGSDLLYEAYMVDVGSSE